MDIGNMDFFFENKTHDFQYIYTAIYQAYLILTELSKIMYGIFVGISMERKKWYSNGKISLGIARIPIRKNEQDIPTEYDAWNIVSTCHLNGKTEACANIRKELNGRYYEIMYGKKITKREKHQFFCPRQKNINFIKVL